MAIATLQTFKRDFKIAIAFSLLGATVGAVGGGIYVSPVFTGKAAVYGDYHPEWEFWAEPGGIASLIGMLIAMVSLRAAWSCLIFKGRPGEGLDREGQGAVTRSMTIAGLTIIGVLLSWVVRGIF